MAKAAAPAEDANEKKRLALKAQSEDLGEARKALESAANIARGLWFTFLSLVAYLVIAVGSVTHRNLFLETPLRLPLLNTELPLVAFFWVAPLMLLVFHGYLLLNLKFLGDNVRHYFRLVDETDLDAASKETLFLQLPNFLMVQLLRERRISPWTFMGHALHGVAILTIVLGPVVALLFLQLRFLPYHSLPVTMVQRFTIIADMILILHFWPGIVGDPATKRIRAYRMTVYGAMFLIVLFSGFVATFPGEWNYGSALVRKSGMADFLLRGRYNEVTGDRQSWFSDTLSLSDEDFVELDEAKLKTADVTVSLRGRNLSEANLARTDLRKADFSGAVLVNANFRGARLDDAVFTKPKQQQIDGGATVTQSTDLLRADFSNARLARASFSGADLQSSNFLNAVLEDANFERSVLHGASFVNAKLAKAKFSYAVMRGAYFQGSDLAGSQFLNADLIGTAIVSSQLQMANFAGARLDAAALVSSNVYGLTEQKPQLDTWLKLGKTRSVVEAVDWGTTLAHELKGENRPLLVSNDGSDFSVAGMEGASDDAAVDPRIKASEISGKSVGINQTVPPEEFLLSWKKRTTRLVTLICTDPEFGSEVYGRAAQILDADNQFLPPFGPFTSTAAAVLLDEPDCREVLKLWQELEDSSAKRDLTKWAAGKSDPQYRAELSVILQKARETAAKAKLASANQKGGLAAETATNQ